MIVVSNSSPIISLATIGQLSLLQQLYGNIAIPTAVYDEIAVTGAGGPGATEVQTSTWIQTQLPKDTSLVTSLQLELDEGEAAAIALAIELGADLLLMDERQGRKVASRFGLRFVGLLGVLIEAKSKQLFPTIKPVLDELIVHGGLWISGALYIRVLGAAGE